MRRLDRRRGVLPARMTGLVLRALFALVVVSSPLAGQDVDPDTLPYHPHSGRLRDGQDIQVRLVSGTDPDAWHDVLLGSTTRSLFGGNAVTCQMFALPELSDGEGTHMVALAGVAAIRVRPHGSTDDAWSAVSVAAIEDLQPAECRRGPSP